MRGCGNGEMGRRGNGEMTDSNPDPRLIPSQGIPKVYAVFLFRE